MKTRLSTSSSSTSSDVLFSHFLLLRDLTKIFQLPNLFYKV